MAEYNTKRRRRGRHTYHFKSALSGIILAILLFTMLGAGYAVWGDKLFPKSIPAGEIPSTEVPETQVPSTDLPTQPQSSSTETNEDAKQFLLLASVANPLPDGFTPKNLIQVPGSIYKMQETAANAMEQMLQDMKRDGITGMEVKSAYRTYEKQKQLYENKVKQYTPNYTTLEEAKAAAAQIVAIPGTSEHQTGLAADIANTPSLEQSFGATDAGKWLKDNSYKYGFIIRYPEGKTDITGIVYEPWHVRFVGKTAAAYITENGLCLEEYLNLANSDYQ